MSTLIAAGAGLVLLAGTLILSRLSVARIAYLAVGTLVFLISWNGIRFAGGSFTNGFFILAAGATLLYVIVDRVPVNVPPWLLGCGAILLCASLATAISPPNPAVLNQSTLQYAQLESVGNIPVTAYLLPRSNLSALLNWEIGLLVLPVVIAVVARTPARIGRLLDLWAAGATLNALVAVLDLVGFHALAATPIIGHRSSGLTLQPNYLALTCLMGLPIAARMIQTTPLRNAFGILAFMTLLGGEYASGSRDGAAVAVVVVLACLVCLPRMRFLIRYTVPLTALALGIALAVPSVGHAIATQVRFNSSGSGVNGSDYQRTVFAHVAEAQFDARPFSGIGMYADNDAQNIYLQILAAGGLVAMVAVVVLVLGLAGSVRRVLSSRLATDATAIGIAIAAWLINGYFDSQIADKYLYVLPGILIACVRVAQTERATEKAPSPASAATSGQPLWRDLQPAE